MLKNKNVLVGVIYRPPGTDIKIFNECLESILTTIKSENKLSYLMGDWNINLLSIDDHDQSQEFLDLMMSNSIILHILSSIDKGILCLEFAGMHAKFHRFSNKIGK